MPKATSPIWERLKLDKALAQVGCGIVVAIAAFWFLGNGETGTRLADVLGTSHGAPIFTTVGALAGSLLGFVLTATTVILSISSSPRMKRITSSPAYPELWRPFLGATWRLAALTLWSLLALVAAT